MAIGTLSFPITHKYRWACQAVDLAGPLQCPDFRAEQENIAIAYKTKSLPLPCVKDLLSGEKALDQVDRGQASSLSKIRRLRH